MGSQPSFGQEKLWFMENVYRFKDLNDACLKDCYTLPEIDLKVDANKGYHQIQMAIGDDDKTAFTTNNGLFCYKKMSFGLKNVGATYQR
jgi:hypothetical protein